MLSGFLINILAPIISMVLPVIVLVFLYMLLKHVENIEQIVTEIKDDAMHVLLHRIAYIEDILMDFKAYMDKDSGSTSFPKKMI